MKLTRRQTLAALGALCVSARLPAQTSQPPFRLQKLHDFEISVSNVDDSVKFYQDVLGMGLLGGSGNSRILAIGDGPAFMRIRQIEDGETPAITWLGYSVEDFDLDGVAADLSALGYSEIDVPAESVPGLQSAMHYWVRRDREVPELFFADARGVIVNLCDPGYCGLESCRSPVQKPQGIFELEDINHFTAFVNDGAGANKYYQDTFGLEVQAYQGPNSPVTGIGDGYQFVMYAGPFPGGENNPASLNHGSFNIRDFTVDSTLEKLTRYGLTARPDGEQAGPLMHYISLRMPARGGAEGGTPEVYFTDPDGILMQLQHTSYCGGGGKLGEVCLDHENG